MTLPWAAAVLAEVEFPPPLGQVLVAHHKPTYEIGYSLERELQAVTCAKAIEKHLDDEPRHAIVLGDFDDSPDSASLRFWTGRQALQEMSVGYRDAWSAIHPTDSGTTFAPPNPLVRAGEMSLELGRRIDYVLIRSGVHGPSLNVTDCSTVFDQPIDGVWASDHFGVLARLALPDHPPGDWTWSLASNADSYPGSTAISSPSTTHRRHSTSTSRASTGFPECGARRRRGCLCRSGGGQERQRRAHCWRHCHGRG